MNTEFIETKWQKKWKKDKIFEPKIDKKKEKYVTTVAYPYANSILHIGHGRTFTMADIISRYQRLKGKNVLYPMGFHISGTPVLAVADNISRGDKKQIQQTKDAISEYIIDKKEQELLLNKFKNPSEIAKFFSSTIEDTFDSIGLSIDWSRQFSTGDLVYQKFVSWQFKKLFEKNILIQSKYPILYSPKDNNAVGEDDIKDGDLNKVSIQNMDMIYFKLENQNSYLAITTLRTDAIFGATNMWLNPKIKLIKIKLNNKNIIIAKKALIKIQYQFDNVEIIEEINPNNLINKKVITPITNKKIPIIQAEFIDENHGTGIVYSSPAGSPHDYIALEEAKNKFSEYKDLNIINTVNHFDKKGNKIQIKFSCPAEEKIKKYNILNQNDPKLEIAKQELYKEEFYSGRLNENTGKFNNIPVKNAKEKIKKELKKLNLIDEFLETSRRAITRNNDIVIVAKLDGQWFLNYKDENIKKQAYALLDQLEYKPEKLRDTQKGYLKWVEMRPCARKRGIGTKLPYDNNWIIEPLSDSTIYQMLYFIQNLISKYNIKAEQLNPKLFDFIYLNKGNINEIEKETNIKKQILIELKNQIQYWESIDLRYTNIGHMSNHLSFLIYHYALIFPKKNWPKCITVGGYLIKDGAKISKSKGNGIPLMKMKRIYSADLYRLYVGIAANYDIEMDFRDEDIKQLEKKFNKLKSLIEKSTKIKKQNYLDLNQTQKWLISKFYSRVKEFFKFMDETRIREAYVSIIYEFLNDISYIQNRDSIENTLKAIRFILEDYIILLTPVIPHFTEEINQIIGNKDYISLKKFNSDPSKYINKDLENNEKIISEIIINIIRQKEKKNINKINKIIINQAPTNRFKLFDELSEMLNKKMTPKEIMKNLNNNFKEDKNFIKKFVPKTFGEGLTKYLKKEEEFKLLNKIIPFLKKEFNVKEITIEKNNNNYSNLTIPTRPNIIIE